MKSRRNILLGLFLILEAIVSVVFAVVYKSEGERGFFDCIVLPVRGIGAFLRQLSLSGAIGNVLAIILYSIICGWPLIFLAVLLKKKKARLEDWLLVLITITVFIVVYWFINLGSMPAFSTINSVLLKQVYPVLFLISMVVAYIVIKIVRMLDGMKQSNTLKILRGCCVFALAIVVFVALGSELAELIKNLMSQKANELNSVSNVRITHSIMILRYIIEQIPLIFMGILAIIIWNMVPEMRESFVNDKVIASLRKLTIVCKISIVIIVLSQVVMNLIQLIAGAHNNISNINVSFPITSIVLIAGLMLISKLIEESAVIKEENEMFI